MNGGARSYVPSELKLPVLRAVGTIQKPQVSVATGYGDAIFIQRRRTVNISLCGDFPNQGSGGCVEAIQVLVVAAK